MHIIKAEEQHITAIRNIYAHHVLHGTGSFETEPPDGFKHGHRLDTVLLQMKLGEGNSTLPEDSDLML